MSSPREFLTFPLLRAARPAPPRRLRRALPAQVDATTSSTTSPLRGLAATALRPARRRALWQPLLDSKFDGRYDDLPATYIWARTRRMSKTRDAAGREIMGWLRGRLPDADRRARASAFAQLGGEIHAGDAVEQIAGAAERRRPGSSSTAGSGRFDHVLCTLAPAAGTAAARRRSLPTQRRTTTAATSASSACSLRVVAQRQPVLHAEHHRPADPADDDRRDDPRRRSGARRRPPALRRRSTSTRRTRTSSGRPTSSRPSTRATRGRSSRPARRRDPRRGRPARAGRRARAPRRRRSAAPGRSSRCPGSRSRRRRTSIPRSSTARP